MKKILLLLILFESIYANSFFSKLSEYFNTKSPPPTTVKNITVAFSPNNGVTTTVVNAINNAEHSIYVAAYSFTSKEIAEALLRAKKRGVTVKIILDRSQASQKYSSSTFFYNQGFDVRIDVKHAIFHDKYMVIDETAVVTGSFNFTKNAEQHNAENLLIIKEPELAKLYIKDWNVNYQMALTKDQFANK